MKNRVGKNTIVNLKEDKTKQLAKKMTEAGALFDTHLIYDVIRLLSASFL